MPQEIVMVTVGLVTGLLAASVVRLMWLRARYRRRRHPEVEVFYQQVTAAIRLLGPPPMWRPLGWLRRLTSREQFENTYEPIVLLFREEYYNPDKIEVQGLAEVNIAKQRNGPTGRTELVFIRSFTRFENRADDDLPV